MTYTQIDLPIAVWGLLYATLVLGCQSSRTLSVEKTIPRAVDLHSLRNNAIVGKYDNESVLFPLRPGLGSTKTFLTVKIDSATYVEQSRMLHMQGQILESETSVPMPDVMLMVGILQKQQGEIIYDDGRPPRPGYHYQMLPYYRDTVDQQGRFAMSVRLDTTSSLLIARKGYYFKLYDVWRLVDSSRTR